MPLLVQEPYAFTSSIDEMKLSEFCKQISACRSCGGGDLRTILDFGEPYISDFLAHDEIGVRAPLVVVRCEGCGLVQLRHTVNAECLFRDYHYRSGTNASMRAALADVVADVQRQVVLEPGDAVLDIGANDGTLLGFYNRSPDFCWGVEPSTQFYHDISRYGWHVPAFWPLRGDTGSRDIGASRFAPGKFKAITSIATFYASDDPNAYVAAIKQHLHPDGVWVVQMQDEGSILRDRAFDYFCHEHLTLWNQFSFAELLSRHGLSLVGDSPNSVNGGSRRWIVKHFDEKDGYLYLGQPFTHDDWEGFNFDISVRQVEARQLLQRLKSEGKTVLGVAASTKANTVLQWFALGPDLIRAIVDVAPEKQGTYTSGSRIPIISEEEAEGMHPDVYVALAWHFLDGLRARAPTVPFLTLLPQVEMHPPLVGWPGSAQELPELGHMILPPPGIAVK